MPVSGTYPGIQGPKKDYFLLNPDQMERGGSRLVRSTWQGPSVPYHIHIDGMGKYGLEPILPALGIQGPKNNYFLAKSRLNGTGWLQARPVHLERAWCAISHPKGWGYFCQFQAPIQVDIMLRRQAKRGFPSHSCEYFQKNGKTTQSIRGEKEGYKEDVGG